MFERRRGSGCLRAHPADPALRRGGFITPRQTGARSSAVTGTASPDGSWPAPLPSRCTVDCFIWDGGTEREREREREREGEREREREREREEYAQSIHTKFSSVVCM